MKHCKQELATVPQTFALLVLTSLSLRDDPCEHPAELSAIGFRSGIGFPSEIGFRTRSTAPLPSRRCLSSSLLFLFCLLPNSQTSNGTRTSVVTALAATATGITTLIGSAAQRHKENSLLFYFLIANNGAPCNYKHKTG